MVTVAPWITAPEGSTTVPLMPPLLVCPMTATAQNNTIVSVLILRIHLSPFFSFQEGDVVNPDL
jgi:hypothetical protein